MGILDNIYCLVHVVCYSSFLKIAISVIFFCSKQILLPVLVVKYVFPLSTTRCTGIPGNTVSKWPVGGAVWQPSLDYHQLLCRYLVMWLCHLSDHSHFGLLIPAGACIGGVVYYYKEIKKENLELDYAHSVGIAAASCFFGATMATLASLGNMRREEEEIVWRAPLYKDRLTRRGDSHY